MAQKSRFTHPKYGTIEITRNPRARHIILRARPDALYITLPPRATQKDLERALDNCGDRLAARREQMQPPPIDAGYRIDTPNFKFDIKRCERSNYAIRHEQERATLLCPGNSDFTGEQKQRWLKTIILNAMRKRAKEILPQRLKTLAALHGLRYTSVSLRNSRTRWGSCSSRGTISLNVHLVLLPPELMDYVLLHELCHTLEMNHSDRFWKKLDSLVRGDSKQLRAALKKYRCEI